MRIMVGLLLVVALTACGRLTNSDRMAAGGEGGGGDSTSMCIDGAADCDDMVVVPDGDCSMVHDPESCPPGAAQGSRGAGSPGSVGSGQILCEGTEPTADAPPGTDCSAPPEPDGREVSPEPDGLTGVHPLGWDRYTADGRQLTVHWYMGVEPCHVLHSVDVVETAQRVTVTLREGSAEPGAACIAIAESVKTTVRLDEPLGDRKVVDGAD